MFAVITSAVAAHCPLLRWLVADRLRMYDVLSSQDWVFRDLTILQRRNALSSLSALCNDDEKR